MGTTRAILQLSGNMPCLKLLLKIMLKTLAVWLIVLITNLDEMLSKP